jgi:hypothetical protein
VQDTSSGTCRAVTPPFKLDDELFVGDVGAVPDLALVVCIEHTYARGQVHPDAATDSELIQVRLGRISPVTMRRVSAALKDFLDLD